MNAYNDFKLFYARQTAIDESGKPLDTATLGSNPVLRASLANISSELSRSVGGISGSFNKLGDIGISFGDYPGDATTPATRNTLVLDDAKLTSALAANYSNVRQVFEFSFASDSTKLQAYAHSNEYSGTNFALNINESSHSYSATYSVNGTPTTIALTATPISGGGTTLTAPSGGPLKGLTLIYNGSGTDTDNINVTTSQGFGDRVYNALDNVLKDTTGSLARELASVNDNNTRYQKDITRIDDQVSRYRNALTDKYAKLEAAIAKVNTILQSLDAQSKAQYGSN